MWFWWFMLVSDLLIPVIMVIAGGIMRKHCPNEINFFIGYRTARSMKNQDTWEFAHRHCGRLWWKTGWIMLIPSVLIHLPFYRSSESTIGVIGCILMTIQLIVLIASIFPTEIALKKAFYDDGTRR